MNSIEEFFSLISCRKETLSRPCMYNDPKDFAVSLPGLITELVLQAMSFVTSARLPPFCPSPSPRRHPSQSLSRLCCGTWGTFLCSPISCLLFCTQSPTIGSESSRTGSFTRQRSLLFDLPCRITVRTLLTPSSCALVIA